MDVQSEKPQGDTNREVSEELRPLALRILVDNLRNPIHEGAQHQPGTSSALVRAHRGAASEQRAGQHRPTLKEERWLAGEDRNSVILAAREPGIDGRPAPALRRWLRAPAQRRPESRKKPVQAGN